MTLPNFLIIGAPKSGTTSLYQTLKSHPQVFMPALKEVNYFNYDVSDTDEGLRNYRALFDTVTDEPAVGEASTFYIFAPKAPGRIKALIPQTKLIAILRNPAERIYSDYWMRRRRGTLSINVSQGSIYDHFSQMLDYHEKNFLYFSYWQSLSRYLDKFDASQIKICFFEDLKRNPQSLHSDLCNFLNVDKALLPAPSEKVYNKGGTARNAAVFKLTENIRQKYGPAVLTKLPEVVTEPLRTAYTGFRDNFLLKDVPSLPKDARKLLVDIHSDDILQLQKFVGRDLSHWLAC